MGLNNEITDFLKHEGCNIVGFADLRVIPAEARQNFDYGILIALSYSSEAMTDNKNGNPQKYNDEFNAINLRLKELGLLIEQHLIEKGYKALAKIPTTVVSNNDQCTVLPHKTVATLAGVGWIGKCAMLVTEKVGSALRLTVVLTNAPFDCGEPIKKSKCPAICNICKNVCPGNAPLGGLWSTDVDRDTFFNASACREAARKQAKTKLGLDYTFCGLCMSSCPFTVRALEGN